MTDRRARTTKIKSKLSFAFGYFIKKIIINNGIRRSKYESPPAIKNQLILKDIDMPARQMKSKALLIIFYNRSLKKSFKFFSF